MTTLATFIALSATALTPAALNEPAKKETIKPPPHQVVAIYFHRTVRCPTCKRIGSMAEQAVRKGFAPELKQRAVELRFVDFQDKKNAGLARQYRISGPTLVLINVFDAKPVRWAPLPKVWQLVAKPDAFRAHVQTSVATYLKQTKEEALVRRPVESKQ